MNLGLMQLFFFILILFFGAVSIIAKIIYQKMKKKSSFLQFLHLSTGLVALQVLIIYCASPLIIHLYLHSETHFAPYPEIDTVFAEGFSKEHFEKVNAGMAKEEVEKLIGKPLHEGRMYDQGCAEYSDDGKAGKYADFSYFSYVVCFKDGKVSEKMVQET